MYRSAARFDTVFRQIRSSSFGMESFICLGGFASLLVIKKTEPDQFGAPERIHSREQLVEDHAQTEHVGSSIHEVRFTSGLFRTHVRRSSDELIVRALANVFVSKGDPKISDVGLPFLINQDVFRFDVSVDQSLGVSIVECLGDDGDELCRLGRRQPILPSSVPQIRPLDDLGHDEAQAVRRAPHVMHRNDVGVVQPGEDAGLGQVGLCIGNSLWMRNLDGDAALQVFVIAQVHRGKATAAKDSLNSVTPDPLGNGDLLKDRRLAIGLGRNRRALGDPRFRQFRRLELRSGRLVRGGIARRIHWRRARK